MVEIPSTRVKRASWRGYTWVVAMAQCECGWEEPFDRMGEANRAAWDHAKTHPKVVPDE